MAEYIIYFHDEWVPEHTLEQLGDAARRARVVLDEMQAIGAIIYSHGGLGAETLVGSAGARPGSDGGVVTTRDRWAPDQEQFGGFLVADLPDDESALSWTTRLAEALGWPQEVHRFRGVGERPGVKATTVEESRGA